MLEILVSIFGLLGAEATAVTVYNAGSLGYNVATWDGASLSSTVKRIHEQNKIHSKKNLIHYFATPMVGFIRS